ncbi:MAG: sialate O-acetylesterase [Ruminococcaceae bacterium]|nr:sialate O-acetylesterase [Oscillospiraceae bacterium]
MRKILFVALAVLVLSFGMLMLGCKSEGNESTHLELNTDFKKPTNLGNGEGKSVKVVLLLGQSNATGCALNSYLEENVGKEQYSVYEQGFSDVLINYSVDNQLNSSNGEFVKTGIGFGHKSEYFGPELGIAERLTEECPGETFVILKYTYSGSCLKTQWLEKKDRGDIYKACIKFTETYMDALLESNYNASLDAICWMQGESDAIGKTADEYYDNQKRFVSFLREDLGKYASCGGIYFIDAGIQEGTIFPRYEVVNEAKARFASESPLNLYFSTIEEGLTTKYEPKENPDLPHYDSMSELKLGYLFAEHIISSYDARN